MAQLQGHSKVGEESRECPDCNSKRIWKGGFRPTNLGPSQRYLCRECGFRFSENSYKDHLPTEGSQLCAIKKAKKLDTPTELKTVARDEKLPLETRGLLVKFVAYLEREGYYEGTSYYDLIRSVASDGANLLNPDDVKAKIAQHAYKFKNGREGKWKDSTKALAVQAYDLFCKMQGLDWIKPKYKGKETALVIPDEKDLDALMSASQSKCMTAFLQCAKETFCDPGEILALEWSEIKGNIITIAHPVKGHYTGQYEVSGRLIALLNRLPRKDKRVFPTTYQSMMMCLNSLKKKAARKQQNPALLAITFKSYRHFGGSMLAHYTNGNVLKVQKALRHKSVLNTMKYIHSIQNLREDDFEETTATTPEEIRKLGKAGWIKYDEATFNNVTIHFYRKPKRFTGF